MRKAMLFLAALAVAIVAVPVATAAGPNAGPKEKLTEVKLLAFNDFHGHLEANTPGTIQTGCCVPNPVTGAPQAITVPAGGAEYFATHLKRLGSENARHVRGRCRRHDRRDAAPVRPLPRRADDRVPQLRRASTRSASATTSSTRARPSCCGCSTAIGRTSAAGRTGGTAYTPFAPRRLPSGGRLPGRDAVLRLDVPVPGGKRRSTQSTGKSAAALVRIVNTSTGEKIAFIGETLKGTPLIVTPAGVAGLDFLDEADTVNALVPMPAAAAGARRSCSCSTRAASRIRRRPRRWLPRTSTSARTSPGRARGHRQSARPRSRRRRERAHARARTSARSTTGS